MDFTQISPCLLGTALLMSMVFTMMNKHKSAMIVDFESTLNPTQLKVYEEIKEERLKIYFKGLALGTLVGALYLFFGNRFIAEAGRLTGACIFTVLVIGTMTAFYHLSPKSKYMVEHLTDPEQTKAWNAIYTSYQQKYWWGLVLGVLGYLLIGYTLTNTDIGEYVTDQFQDYANTVEDYVSDLPVVGEYFDRR
jgi:hypothetical protein